MLFRSEAEFVFGHRALFLARQLDEARECGDLREVFARIVRELRDGQRVGAPLLPTALLQLSKAGVAEPRTTGTLRPRARITARSRAE